jgi:hypothetical protein
MADDKPKRKPKVTAFELDGSVVGDVDAHPFTFGGFPGRWQVGRPILPSALGLTVTRMRELIDQFNLPLVEVQVNEKTRTTTSRRIRNGSPSGAQALEPTQTQPELLEVNGGLVPGPTPPPPHPEMQPFAAEQIAADTKRLHPDVAAEAIVEELAVDEDSEQPAARQAAGEETT